MARPWLQHDRATERCCNQPIEDSVNDIIFVAILLLSLGLGAIAIAIAIVGTQRPR